jgi:anti-sigma B factor antagonist
MDTVSGTSGSPSSILKIETDEHDGAYVVRLSGEVDLQTITLLNAALDGRIHNSRNVVLDCRHLTYMDSLGLKLLADLQEKGRRFVLVAPTPTIQKILRITALDTLLPVAASVEDALNRLAEEG